MLLAIDSAVIDGNRLKVKFPNSEIQLGHSEGVEEGIKAFILDNIEENIPKERIIEKLQRRFDLTEEQAVEKYEKYGE